MSLPLYLIQNFNFNRVSGRDGAYASTQLAILTKLTTILRSGKYTGSLGKPSNIVHAGHSFGSFLSNALIAQSPQLSDAALLTGLGYDMSGSNPATEALGLRIANDQRKFKDRSNEYLAPFDAPALAAFFLHAGSFEEDLLELAYDQAQPLAAIELLTLSGLNLVAPEFTGPVMVSCEIQVHLRFLCILINPRSSMEKTTSHFVVETVWALWKVLRVSCILRLQMYRL